MDARRATTASHRRAAVVATSADAAADDDEKGSQTVAAIERAADTLLYLAGTDRADSGVTEIARDLKMSKAAVHRILASLRSRNLVTLDDETRRYSLGAATLTLGMTYLGRIDVRRLASAQLANLSAATSETSTLSVRTGTSRMYIDQVTPEREVIMSVKLGVPYPLHAGSSSKAFLAFLDEAEIKAYLSGPLQRVTPSTVVDERALRAELALIRARGWADSLGERHPGAASVAAPILNYLGQPLAVMSVCGPSDRFLTSKQTSVGHLLEATAQVSERLGYRRRR